MPSKDRKLMAELEGKKEIDYHKHRSGDRHKTNTSKKTKWDRQHIVAWDGEGADIYDEDGIFVEQVYNLIANSSGARIYKADGLSTKSCLDFFLKYGDNKAINVIYGGSYDVNMIIKDLPPLKIAELYDKGTVWWECYRITYAHRKRFHVSRLYMRGTKITEVSFTLWDVLGFYQASFVVACRKWLGDLPILEEINAMKMRRDHFTPEMKDQIIEYNRVECELLVQLVEALFIALGDASIKLSRYDGAGSIAATLLRKNNVLDHKGEPNEQILERAQHAYSGGRIEAIKVGHEIRPIHRYDINSAYPFSCLSLPSYKDATWSGGYEWNGNDSSLVLVEWGFWNDKPGRINPLWYRSFDGSILYPCCGQNWIYGAELKNLLKYFDGEVDYGIIGVSNVELATDYKPFGFLEEMYAERLMLKKAGNMAAEAFKLGMNSTYGKLAQQAGYRNGRIPTYHQLLWAGEITARTRAQLYDAAMQKPESVIAFATDAIITTEPLDLICGTGLGEWTHEEFTGITMVQPGVYWLQHGNEWDAKYRGFDKGTLKREHIVGNWLLGQDYTIDSRRFIGMGAALQTKDFYSHWRKWEVAPRTLSLTPAGKRFPGYGNPDTCYWDHLCDTMPTDNLEPYISWPYPLAWREGPEAVRQIAEMNNRQLDEDMLDSLDTYADLFGG